MNDRSRFASEDLFADLRRALSGDRVANLHADVDLDLRRRERIGVPEIILATGKRTEQVLEFTATMLERNGRALISRVDDATHAAVADRFAPDHLVERPDRSSVVRVAHRNSDPPECHGSIAVFTAGTSDLPLAGEVRLVAEELGCTVQVHPDTGVAGLHRLIEPLSRAIDSGTDCIVVIAGMDGALPSVISGLSPVPVIGLPSSTGYGFGGNGEAALMTMLQSCAPGLTVVNIDNSIGAAVAAARIARLSAEQR